MHTDVIGGGYRMLALEDSLDRLADAGTVFTTLEAAATEIRERLSAAG